MGTSGGTRVTAELLQDPTVRPSAQHGLQVRHHTPRGGVGEERWRRRGKRESTELSKRAETGRHSYFEAS